MSMHRHQGVYDDRGGKANPATRAHRPPTPNLPNSVSEKSSTQHRLAPPSNSDISASIPAGEQVTTEPQRENYARLTWAILGLWIHDPDMSARSPLRIWQVGLLTLPVGMLIGLAVASTETAHAVLATVLSLPFLCVLAVRLAALWELQTSSASPSGEGQHEANLPVYSVLVPLFRETEVLPRLVKALGNLDYPADRLDILLVLEEIDVETRTRLNGIRLPPQFRLLVVPDSEPRTKPKALAYALPAARGDLLVVYDAEDMPEPGQLRQAAAIFAKVGLEVACLQARLNVDDAPRSFLSRQFALEYSALFDALLPALERLCLPIPLGGTSNHFRISALREVGGWDPFNVTEDADLGIRLARQGFAVRTLRSTTWEESPPDFGNWHRQRTRWLKGWMQTYLVHTRQPKRVHRELGTWRHLGLHMLMGAMLLSVLAYPWGLVLVALSIADGRFFAAPVTNLEQWLWWSTALNLGLGFASAMLLGATAVWRRGWRWLAPWALAMPIYWLLISVAGYRALWQLVRQPYLWEKTHHTGGDS